MNRAMPSLHGGPLEIKLTVPLINMFESLMFTVQVNNMHCLKHLLLASTM